MVDSAAGRGAAVKREAAVVMIASASRLIAVMVPATAGGRLAPLKLDSDTLDGASLLHEGVDGCPLLYLYPGLLQLGAARIPVAPSAVAVLVVIHGDG